MGLKEGNIESRIFDNFFLNNHDEAKALLGQMLQALDYLASLGVVHRDVKPENILYERTADGGRVRYQLADFGLANFATDAGSFAGTSRYRAPELEMAPSTPQSHMMDVFSLFVTMAMAMDAAGFRGKGCQTLALRIAAVKDAADSKMLFCISAMVNVDPAMRASAADILVEFFHGEGRSTIPTPASAVPAAMTESRRQLRPRDPTFRYF